MEGSRVKKKGRKEREAKGDRFAVKQSNREEFGGETFQRRFE